MSPNKSKALATRNTANAMLANLAQLANAHARAHVFDAYRQKRAANTLARQARDLELFAQALTKKIQLTGHELQTNPSAWTPITWGLVEGFRNWQLKNGYAVHTVNLRLATIRKYAQLAGQAGTLGDEEVRLIRSVTGYSRKESVHVDEQRASDSKPTRRPHAKKAAAIVLNDAQLAQLRAQPDTPQGRRDALLIRLMVDLGLRVGEVVGLRVNSANLHECTLTFRRPKVEMWQTHRLQNGALAAMRAYVESDCAGAGADDALLRASERGGALSHMGITRFAIAKRIALLGARIGVRSLSPHDLRHTWATRAARNGTSEFALRVAGGWSSPAMPHRYAQAASIANEGVKLGDE